jgi:hypothetical protein
MNHPLPPTEPETKNSKNSKKNHPLPPTEPETKNSKKSDLLEQTAPTWLAQPYRTDDSEYLVEQYRRRQEPLAKLASSQEENYDQYRQRILDRQREQKEFLSSHLDMPATPQRPTMPTDELRAQDRHFGNQRLVSDRQVPPFPGAKKRGPNKFILAGGTAAIVAGGWLGFAVTQYDKFSETMGNGYSYVAGMMQSTSPKPAEAKVIARETTIAKKPIGIASLKVADAEGTLNSMIPLMLSADPAFENQVLAIKVSGLPASAYLSAGTKLSDSTWLLKDGEETGLNLFVPESKAPQFDMTVAAIETKTGELAAPIKEMTVALNDADLQITPASALPETATEIAPVQQTFGATAVPQATPVTPEKPALSAEVSGLLQKGDVLLKAGDLVIARQFYARAFQLGAAEGAMGVAKTYDPSIYKQLKVQGISPDAALAAEWYNKAKLAGVSDAEAALTMLPAASLP